MYEVFKNSDAIGNVTKDEKQHVAFNDWNVYGKLDSLVKDDGTHLGEEFPKKLRLA
jgi:hypothetical protein